jgi:hypothetical protein
LAKASFVFWTLSLDIVWLLSCVLQPVNIIPVEKMIVEMMDNLKFFFIIILLYKFQNKKNTMLYNI